MLFRALPVALLLAATPALAFDCPTDCDDKVAGDANGNGSVEVGDLIALLAIFSGGAEPCPEGDVNGDGTIDIADAIYLSNYLYNGGPAPVELPCCDPCADIIPGDANRDGMVDSSDATIIINFVATGSADLCLLAADADGDGDVDADDAQAILDYLFANGAAPARPDCK